MSRPNLVTVEPVLFTFMLCTFLSFPITEQLVYEKLCQVKYNSSVCDVIKENRHFKDQENIVQAATSKWMLYFNVALTLPSATAALAFGPMSDKVGRKFFMILPLIGNAIDAISMTLNAYFMQWNVAYMMFGVSVSGFFGSFAMVLMAVFAYMSDITTEKNRTLRLTILESMTFLGGCVGELIGGVMVDHVGYFKTYLVVFGLQTLNLLYVIFLVNESYISERKVISQESLASCCSRRQVIQAVKVFAQKRPNSKRKNLLLLLVAFFFGLMVFVGSNTVKVLFSIHRPLSFKPSMVGYFLAVSMLYRGIGVLSCSPLFIRVLKLKDYTITIISLCGTMLMFIVLGLSTKLWMLFVVPFLDLLGGLSIPCIRSLMSKIVGKDQQGALFSVNATIEVLCSLAASLLFNNIYSATVSWHPGVGCKRFFPTFDLAFKDTKTYRHRYLRQTDKPMKYQNFDEDGTEESVDNIHNHASHRDQTGDESINYSS
eukprot:gene20141-22114_t